jgi:hypothetical protein
LLPNPASPQTDAKDEFIELSNPTDESFNLAGYKLQTGTKSSYSHTFVAADTIAAGSYKAFNITQTKTTLSNSGGKARLLDPAGAVVFETGSYGTAANGVAWAFLDGTWKWTSTPTPGAQNIFTAPVTSSKNRSGAVNSAGVKTPSAKSGKTAKASSGSKGKGSTAGKDGSSGSNQPAMPAPIHPLVLAGVGGSALAYAAYEYRNDLFNRIYQLRKYLRSRRPARAKA